MNVQVCFLKGRLCLTGFNLGWLNIFPVAAKNYFSTNLNDYILYLHLKFFRYKYITFFEYSFQFCA